MHPGGKHYAFARALGLAAGIISLLAAGAVFAACPTAPVPVRDLTLDGYYSDKAKSVVETDAEARKQAAVEPLRDYLDTVTKQADRAILKQRGDAAACALHWLRAWTLGRAYLGTITRKQAEAQAKWDLAGLAIAYLKLRHFASSEQRRDIEPWLIAMADRARAVYDSPGKIRNNHWYWLGLGLGAIGLAADSPRHWDEARRIMSDAARDIGADGLLPLEIKRGRRALHHHSFSAMPLVTLAEIAAARGEDWYALGDGALHRLVLATAAGLVEPARFDHVAGVAQEQPPKPRAGWLQLYAHRFRGRLPDGLPSSKPRHRWLGGDVNALVMALAFGKQ